MCAGCAGRRAALSAAAARVVVQGAAVAATGRDLGKAVYDRMARLPRLPLRRP